MVYNGALLICEYTNCIVQLQYIQLSLFAHNSKLFTDCGTASTFGFTVNLHDIQVNLVITISTLDIKNIFIKEKPCKFLSLQDT